MFVISVTQKSACGPRQNWFTRFERWSLQPARGCLYIIFPSQDLRVVTADVVGEKRGRDGHGWYAVNTHDVVLTVFRIAPIEDINQPGAQMSHRNYNS